MARGILLQDGGGGITSSDVTASRNQVLEGRTTVTSDSNDEIISGTMLSDATLSNGNQMLNGFIGYGRYGTKYTGTIPSQGALTYTPSTSAQTVSVSGKYMTGNITINAIPSNFKDTNNLTLDAAGRMLSGYTALGKNGTKYTGTIPSQGALTYTPSTSAQTASVSGKYMTGNITINAIPSKYKDCSRATISNNNQMLSGIKAVGSNGTLYTGNIASMNGVTITPTKSSQTVSCSGKKMNGNVVVNAIPNNFIATGDWAVFNKGTFDNSGYAWVPQYAGYNVRSTTPGWYDSETGESGSASQTGMSKKGVNIQYFNTADFGWSYGTLPLLYRYKSGSNINLAISVGDFNILKNSAGNPNYIWPVSMLLLNRSIDISVYKYVTLYYVCASGSTKISEITLYLCPKDKLSFGIKYDITWSEVKSGLYQTKKIPFSEFKVKDNSGGLNTYPRPTGQCFFGITAYNQANQTSYPFCVYSLIFSTS